LPVVALYVAPVQPLPLIPLVPPVKAVPFNVKPVAFIVPFTSKSVEGSALPIPTRLSGLANVSKYIEVSAFNFHRASNLVSHAKSLELFALATAIKFRLKSDIS
jgi:hypothetical protein